jgi:hypothetical protein
MRQGHPEVVYKKAAADNGTAAAAAAAAAVAAVEVAPAGTADPAAAK